MLELLTKIALTALLVSLYWLLLQGSLFQNALLAIQTLWRTIRLRRQRARQQARQRAFDQALAEQRARVEADLLGHLSPEKAETVRARMELHHSLIDYGHSDWIVTQGINQGRKVA